MEHLRPQGPWPILGRNAGRADAIHLFPGHARSIRRHDSLSRPGRRGLRYRRHKGLDALSQPPGAYAWLLAGGTRGAATAFRRAPGALTRLVQLTQTT